MTFLVNEQNVSVMYIYINAISLHLDLNSFQQDVCFCSKLGMEVENARSNLKTSLSQIWEICQLLPFVRVGQKYISLIITGMQYDKTISSRSKLSCKLIFIARWHLSVIVQITAVPLRAMWHGRKWLFFIFHISNLHAKGGPISQGIMFH